MADEHTCFKSPRFKPIFMKLSWLMRIRVGFKKKSAQVNHIRHGENIAPLKPVFPVNIRSILFFPRKKFQNNLPNFISHKKGYIRFRRQAPRSPKKWSRHPSFLQKYHFFFRKKKPPAE